VAINCSSKISNINLVQNDYKPQEVEHMFIKIACINGHKFRCLVDTGSAKTLIKTSAAKRFRLDVNFSQENILRGFTGNTLFSNQTAYLTIKLTEVSGVVNAIIVDDHYLSEELLIGRDFIEQPHILMIKQNNTVIFRNLPTLKETYWVLIMTSFLPAPPSMRRGRG
jgi:hypothetical protein